MARGKQNDEVKAIKEQETELTRRRCMLMAATTGITQSALSDALINQYWDQNFAGGPLDDLLRKQLEGA